MVRSLRRKPALTLRDSCAPMMNRYFAIAAVLMAHLVGIVLFTRLTNIERPPNPQPTVPTFEARILVQRSGDPTPIPEISVHFVDPDMNALMMLRFDDLEDLDLSGVIAVSSAPQLRRIQITDTEGYARKAGLQIGQAATVLLAIEVLPDGTVGEATVNRSSGTAAVDAAAIEYAKGLRWIPGTADHQPRAMRILFPITLSRSA